MNKLFEPIGISDGDMEEILLNSEFGRNGWLFKNTDEKLIAKLYPIYREVMLNGLLPLAAVSGISLDSFQNSTVFDVTNYAGIKESLIEVMNNTSLLLFPPQSEETEVSCSINSNGAITSDNLVFMNGSVRHTPVTAAYLFNASKPLKLSLRLSTGTGSNRIHAHTSHRSINKKYIPVRTSYSLYKYINIFGYDKTSIRQSVSDRLDCDALKTILFSFILGEVKAEKPVEVRQHNVSEIFQTLYERISRYGKAINALKEIFYKELGSDEDYKAIRDEVFAERQKAAQAGRELTANHPAMITKTNMEFEIFKGLFIQSNTEETARYLSGIPKISHISAVQIAEIIHEFV